MGRNDEDQLSHQQSGKKAHINIFGQKSYTHQQFQLFWQKGTLTILPNMNFLLHFSENYLCLMNKFECLIQNL